MPPPAPPLPTKFPCWCKAVYSWGGETKRDLGFIEGDLIECLNAGDGQWWMGRLRRDRRAVGLFPSNFVELLDESLWPGAPRGPGVTGVSRSGTNAAAQKPLPQKQKSTFRKPFQAYYNAGQPNPVAHAREKQEKTAASGHSDSQRRHKPYSSMKHAKPPGPSPNPSPRNSVDSVARVPPLPERNASNMRNRAPSPLPPRQEYGHYRAVSPAPPHPADFRSARAVSPGPPQHYRGPSPGPPQAYRAPSPAPPQAYRAPSPAPPQQYRAVSPAPQQYQPYSRGPSPSPYQQQFYPPSPGLPPTTQQQYQAYSPAASPVMMDHPQYYPYRSPSRGPSPAPFEDEVGEASPPPPPPPPHRVLHAQANRGPSPAPYQISRSPSPAPYNEDGYRSGYHTPTSHSPVPRKVSNMTPSPVTNAMNDVMTSLEDMTVAKRSPSPARARTPADPWAPEAFGEAFSALSHPRRLRPNTSLGLGMQENDMPPAKLETEGRSNTAGPQLEGPPQVGNYVARMEERLRMLSSRSPAPQDELFMPTDQDGPPPAPPPKNSRQQRPQTSYGDSQHDSMYDSRSRSSIGGHPQDGVFRKPTLKHRKSAYEVAKQGLGRTFTNKTNTTNSTEATNSTGHTLWSGTSAGANSATSSGSFARRKWGTIREHRERSKSVVEISRPRAGSRVGSIDSRPDSPFSGGISYHSSHATSQQQNSSHTDWSGNVAEAGGLLGGLTSPKPKRTGFFKKMISSARANAANARNTISSTPSRPNSRGAGLLPNGVTSIAGGSAVFHPSGNVAKEMGMGGSVDWVQVRRDINRSNSLSKNERIERAERCQMNDIAVINPIEVLLETIEGDEGLDGLPVPEPLDFSQCNLSLVDKNTRFIQGLPPMTTPVSLAQGYVCRPYRSDVQRLRAIFTWVSERISWEEDYEGDVDTRRVIQSKRGCSEEIAVLVMDMCAAVGLHSEVIRGYLKAPGEELDFEMVAHPNHWWNAVIVDGEWRIMDCSLANPTNPRRSAYSSAGSQVAESGFFLARPSEICYTHVPLLPEAQHIIPPISHEVLMALPCACPPYFMNDIEIADFDTSLLSLENLEMAHIHFFVPEDVEAVAEVEARIFARDGDGDVFESGDVCRKRALCQPEWIGGRKRYTVKAVLPGDEGHATLKVYAGKKGLMHSIKSNPHPFVFGLPLTHIGQNPPYDFLTLHPTPHAQRHDLYVAQPQCARLAVNNTFVFAVRQHPSSLTWTHSPPSSHAHSQSTGSAMLGGRVSPNPFARPTSALSMVSASASNAGSIFSASSSGSDPLNPSSRAPPGASQKPAKLAIQSPSGKIIRLMRKSEHMIASSHGAGVGGASDGEKEGGDGSVWETIIKIGERGTWRGLVLADRSARWCVFAEWESF
ncbi:cytokinesis protein 3 [Diplodia seriata]|uniref:Cytokinesis protein 3 n=1 Tax=Diplodia seriata TaxID=420778 RepID=A0A1S8BE05_9PEZI|nr:cytokinesis protein 3 [Diplodia seriata]